MKKSTQKNILDAFVFFSLIIFAIVIDNIIRLVPIYNFFIYGLSFIFSTSVYIGVYSYWITSIYKRIMQNRVRNYLMLIGANIIFWLSTRSIKWSAFEFVIDADRFLWYMYYIPMISLSLLFLFVSLYVGEKEDYRPSTKWNLLYIPAILLIIAILTNDIHKAAFHINTSVHAYGRDYTYGPVYYIVAMFILSMVVLGAAIIIRKFSVSKSARKKAVGPAIVIIIIILYTIAHIYMPVYGIGYYIDITVFGCTMAIVLLEIFIRTGLIHSNMGHSECFSMANISTQILNNKGETVYISDNSLPVSKGDFETLKAEKSVFFNSSTLSQIAPINGGYVLWNSDVSQITNMIEKLKTISDKLYKEVDLLTIENEQKSEKTRLLKLNDLHNIMLKEIMPISDKIKREIQSRTIANETEIKRLLFETSMNSTYIKRKVNLILTQQTEEFICAEDMRYCFLECFQLLKLYDITCVINIINDFEMSIKTAIASFDLYQNIVQSVDYNFDAIYVTYNTDENNIVFVLQISGDINLKASDIISDNLDILKGKIKIIDETDSYYISLIVPK